MTPRTSLPGIDLLHWARATTVLLSCLACLSQPLAGARASARPAGAPPVGEASGATAGASDGSARGYWLATADGKVLPYGAQALGSVTVPMTRPAVGIAATPSGGGYWLDASDGGIFSFGDARFLGSRGGAPLNKPIVGMAATATGDGYWLVASDGGIFAYGDARFFGSMGGAHLNQPIVAMAATATGDGYWLVASDGGIFAYGDARFFGSLGGSHLNRPIVGMASPASGDGYWLVASDGGIFAYGDAHFLGSVGGTPGVSPVAGMSSTPSGNGYWLVASDGGIFAYGDAPFFGSPGGMQLSPPVIGMAAATLPASHTVGIFYYPWYANPAIGGVWRHWDEGGHAPPLDVGATYYPARGAYNNDDPALVDGQMAEIASAGVDQVIVSWWGLGSFEDHTLGLAQQAAAAHGLQVVIHLEPYPGRSGPTVINDIASLMSRGISQFYVYRADLIDAGSWAAVRARYPSITLFANGAPSFIKSGALVRLALSGGFNGVYTYDPLLFSGSDFPGFCAQAKANGLICAPSVAPGYDARRATGDPNVRGRAGGGTYDSMWNGALSAKATTITITSYNEWHEGTQIEPAQPFCIPGQGVCYKNYTGDYGQPDPAARQAYLSRTAHWTSQFHTTP